MAEEAPPVELPPDEGVEAAPEEGVAEGAAYAEGGELPQQAEYEDEQGEVGNDEQQLADGEHVEEQSPNEGDLVEGDGLAEHGDDEHADGDGAAALDDGAVQPDGEEMSPAEGEEAAEQADAAEADGGEEEGREQSGEPAEPEPPAPPPPPPYVPPEVGDDYIPVAQRPPLPLPHATNEEGKLIPLPGVESLFLTGTTVELVGLSHLGADKEGGALMAFVNREDLLKDIQFRGAISDFHAFKAKILEADYDQICFRINEDDIFGDGNNFQMAVKKEACDVWQYIEEESAVRKQLLIDEELRAAIERAKPRSKKAHKVKPWISLGSEVEIEESTVRARRDGLRMVVSRKRREFAQPWKLSDKDAHELWNSSQMECRPFKDPNFDLRKMEQDVAVQAVPATAAVAVQAGADKLRPNAVQYTPLTMIPEEAVEAARQPKVAKFLDRVSFLCEAALIQNEITNIFSDDFAGLTEEEGMSGNRKESIVTEYQSFTHLTYSKNKVVSAIQWLPHRKGVVAVACTEALSHSERVARAGRPTNAHILIWNFKDPIHPEYVLQAPFEVFSFQYNPANPEIIAGGCYNGQVVIWDTTHEHERIARMRAASSRQDTPDSSDDASIPVVKYRYLSAVEFSHHMVVSDLQWLPGIELSTRGKVARAQDSAGAGGGTPVGGAPRECSFFATTSGDGKVNFWDIRVDRLMKKGRKAEDVLDLVWKPTHSVHVISLIGMDFGGSRICFNFGALERGLFFLGSSDGELAYADFVKPDGEDNPDYTKAIIQAHVGPIVALERSPFFEDIILTVGDWSFQVWKEGQQTPLFTSGYASDYYTCGCWSPSRPAVLYLTDQAGNLEIWDMLDRSHEPSIKVTLASTPFMSMSFMGGASQSGSQAAAAAGNAGAAGAAGTGASQQQQQASQQQGTQFLALGDSAGVLRIVELPRNLRRPVPNERKLMATFLEREADRVADVALRRPAREAASKAAEEAKKRAADESEAAAKDAAMKDQSHAPPSKAAAAAAQKAAAAALFEVDEKAEAEYAKIEHRFKIQLGLIEPEDKDRS